MITILGTQNAEPVYARLETYANAIAINRFGKCDVRRNGHHLEVLAEGADRWTFGFSLPSKKRGAITDVSVRLQSREGSDLTERLRAYFTKVIVSDRYVDEIASLGPIVPLIQIEIKHGMYFLLVDPDFHETNPEQVRETLMQRMVDLYHGSDENTPKPDQGVSMGTDTISISRISTLTEEKAKTVIDHFLTE